MTKQQHEPLNVESDHVKVRQTQAAFFVVFYPQISINNWNLPWVRSLNG
jgi:hypothetical protein